VVRRRTAGPDEHVGRQRVELPAVVGRPIVLDVGRLREVRRRVGVRDAGAVHAGEVFQRRPVASPTEHGAEVERDRGLDGVHVVASAAPRAAVVAGAV